MNKILGGFAVAALLVPAFAFAADFRAGDQLSISSSEHIANDVYLAGGTVTSAGAVAGDLLAGGGTITISGDVTGDVAAGGGTITVLSNIGDDVRLGGGTIVMQGHIASDAIIAGGQVTVGGTGIGGDAAIAGGMIRIDAPIKGSLRIMGGKVYLNAPVDGAVRIEADEVTLGPAAVLNGTLTYKAAKELTKEAGATVKGEVKFEQRPDTKKVSAAAVGAILSLVVLGKFLALLVCALLLGLVFKRYSREVVTRALERPWVEIGRGLVVIVALPVVSVVLLLTIIGIPLGVLGLISTLALCLISWIVAAIILGSVVHHYVTKREVEVSWKTILLGSFLYSLLQLIPFVGWIAHVLIGLLAIGAVATMKWNVVKEWR